MATFRKAGWLQGLSVVLPVMTITMGSAILAANFPLIMAVFQQRGVPGAEYMVNALLTLPALCIALFSPAAGAVADRFGRRGILIAAMIVYGCVGVVPLLVENVWIILASRFVLGVIESVIMTASTTLIGDYFKGAQRDHWLAMQTTVASASSIIMFPLGGYLGERFGWNYPFAMYVISFLLVVLVIAFTWEPDAESADDERPTDFRWRRLLLAYGATLVGLAATIQVMERIVPQRSLAELVPLSIALLYGLSLPLMALAGLRSKARERPLHRSFPWLRLAGIMVVVALASMMFFLLQIKMAQTLAESGIADTFKTSIVIAVTSLGIPLGTVIFSRISRTAISYLVLVDFSIIAAGFFGMAWAPDQNTLIAFSFLNQLGCGLTLPTVLTWSMRQLTFSQRGRGMGIFCGYFNGGQFVGPQVLTYVAGVFAAGMIRPAYALVGYAAAATAAGALVALLLGKGVMAVEHQDESVPTIAH